MGNNVLARAIALASGGARHSSTRAARPAAGALQHSSTGMARPTAGSARPAAGAQQPPSPRPTAGVPRPEAARAEAARLQAVAPWPSMAASGVDEDGSGGETMAASGREGSMAISGGEPSMAALDVGVGRKTEGR